MYLFIFKRLFDILVSLLLIILLFPLFLIIILILLFTGENEVFYLQERIGHNNIPFKIWKFTTMVKNSPNIGTGSLTIRNDPRVLPFGKFLRKTKINELPQLINVLIGNMSIVGPRPQMNVDFLAYSNEIQKSIYNSKPGVTGIGSIVFRDEEREISNAKDPKKYYKEIIAPKKGALELWYNANVSFLLDIKLIFLTIIVVFFPETSIVYRFLPIIKEIENIHS